MSRQLNVTSEEIDKSACYQLPGEGSKVVRASLWCCIISIFILCRPAPVEAQRETWFHHPVLQALVLVPLLWDGRTYLPLISSTTGQYRSAVYSLSY